MEYIVDIPDKDITDRKRLIRCKDCRHGSLYCTEDVCGKTLIECNHPVFGDAIAIHAWDWFCAGGEPKDGGQG